MKLSKQTFQRALTPTVATLLVVTVPFFAAAAIQGDSVADISDEKLEAVARAYIEVFKINRSYEARIQAAETTEEADRLRAAANHEMVDVIESEEDVTAQEYNDVMGAIADDVELRERLQAQVDEIQEEESEKN